MEPEFDVAGEAAEGGDGGGSVDGAPGEGWGDSQLRGEMHLSTLCSCGVPGEQEGQADGDEEPRHLQMEFIFISFYSFTFYVAVRMGHRISCLLDKHHP